MDAREPRLGDRRGEVLDVLQAAAAPLAAQQVAERTSLHVNTARFHLDGLVQAGLAERMTQPRPTPGRPHVVYRPLGALAPAGQRNYRLLAEILTGLVAGLAAAPSDAAIEAGRAWGRQLSSPPASQLGSGQQDPGKPSACQPGPRQPDACQQAPSRPGAAQAVRQLAGTLDGIGFAPEVIPPAAPTAAWQLRLRRCPFREVAEAYPGVVCPVHLGLMQGVLAGMGAPVTASGLEPNIEPGLCLAHVTGTATASTASTVTDSHRRDQ